MTPTELRRLAEAAAPGPWVAHCPKYGQFWRIDAGSGRSFSICSTHGDSLGDKQDAAYIAALSPSQCIELLDELDALRKALESCPCPRPANVAPDGTTIGECIKRGECGCVYRAALG